MPNDRIPSILNADILHLAKQFLKFKVSKVNIAVTLPIHHKV